MSAAHTITGLRAALVTLAGDIRAEAIARGLPELRVYTTRPGTGNPEIDAPALYWVLADSSSEMTDFASVGDTVVFVLRLVVALRDLEDAEPQLDQLTDAVRDVIDTRLKTRAAVDDNGPLGGTCRRATRKGMREGLLEHGGTEYLFRAFPIECEQRRPLDPPPTVL